MAESAFLPNGLQYAWDSTSLGALKKCPRYYQYAILEGWQPAIPSTHLTFGQLYHKALENYDQRIAAGQDKHAALREVLREQLIASKDMPTLKTKSRHTLFRTTLWYIDRWANDNLQTVMLQSGKPAVELSFQYHSDVQVGDYGHYVFCGHFDKLVRFSGDIYVQDKKTTGQTLGSWYFEEFSPNNQMSFYPYFASKIYDLPVRGVLIDAAQVGVTFSEYGREVAYRTRGQLDEWYQDTLRVLRQNVTYHSEGHWPINDTACRMCSFKAICKLDPSVRQTFLQANYVKKPWNPLQTRTESEPLADE